MQAAESQIRRSAHSDNDLRHDKVGRKRELALRPLLLLAMALLTAFHLCVLGYHLGVTLAFPYDLNYGEGYVLNDAVRLASGQPIYVDPQQFPMVRSPYPPLFPLLWSFVVPLTGPEFAAGRALEVLALVAIGALVTVNARRVRCGAWPAVAALGLVAASPFVYQWAGYARVDLLALLLAMGGVVAAQWVGGRRGLLLAGLLCVLALWTKQTTITAALAVGIAYASRSWRLGLAFVALVAIPSLVLGMVLNASTQGEFARHVLLGNATNPMLPLRAAIYVGTFAVLHLIALGGGLWWLRRALVGHPSPIALYLVIALFGALSAGNGGSSVNYLIEPVLALALASPFAWRAVSAASTLAGPLFAVVQLAVLVHWPNSFGTTYLAEHALGHTPVAADWAVGARVDDVVRAEPGEVIAEPAGFAVRNGRPVYVQPIDLRAEQLQGRWHSEALVAALASGRFPVIITAYNLFPADAERALGADYALAQTYASPDGLTFRVYKFKTKS